MVFFMETKIDEKRMEKIKRRCGFVNGINVGAEGSRGGICLAWKEELQVRLKTFSPNNIDVLIKEESVNEEWRFTGSPLASEWGF
ncbi:BEACH domain-containing lvsC [Gossypium australe]|uniref:BEACH domain-containing lvsC n=1 Tax=Gossypium australe TaxID=47621 RepID=A0A5B6W651_9ROSI|nr:BEACH domain-containing lvsC [Gossypium australe]